MSERTTIDFGIDLGTTNSAVSVLRGVVPEVIKNNMGMDITSSAVYIKRQRLLVGFMAKNGLESNPDDVQTEFKRRMGTDFRYEFKSSGRRLSPVELSAEVLKSLRGDISLRLGEDARAAVITIPAMFEQRQCNATKEAGGLAGFTQTALLQEPVAASLAYGFQREMSGKSFWLVFDFGGGTFDAAVMKAEDGDLSIVNHGGDNFLGGADIDWAVVEDIVVPRIVQENNLPDFRRGNVRWRTEFAKIKRAVEEAKIQLSCLEDILLNDYPFVDADGNEVDLGGFKLTRGEVARAAEPLIVKACDICLRTLREKGMDRSAIERVLLVGGPTLAPYFREIVSGKLDIPLDFSVDPLTVVSRGAAVFAGTQRLDAKPKADRPCGVFSIALNYNPVGADEDPRVSGEVAAAGNGETAEGCSIEFVNRLTHWSSGKIPLRDDGTFNLRLRAEAGSRNTFDILLTAADGSKREVSPSTLDYTIGATVKAQVVSNDIGIAKADNTLEILVPKGTEYPFKKTKRDFHTITGVRKGTDETLKIPVVEGHQPYADCNVPLGYLTVNGHDIFRDLPAGTDVEITLEVKGSGPGNILVTAYFPDFDVERNAKLDYAGAPPSKAELETQLAREKKRAYALSDESTEDRIEDLVAAAEQKIASAGDLDAAYQARGELIALRTVLNQLESEKKWPDLVKEAADIRASLSKKLATQTVSKDQLPKGNALIKEMKEAEAEHDAERLERAVKDAWVLDFELDADKPDVWKALLAHMHKNDRDRMRDKQRAAQLFEDGARHMKTNDVIGLRRTVAALWRLLPEDVVEQMKGALGSGVIS
jgi:molecular chaperone DnaK